MRVKMRVKMRDKAVLTNIIINTTLSPGGIY